MPPPSIHSHRTTADEEACPLQPITIHLSVSSRFKILCNTFNMQPHDVLQLFINHFCVYAEIVAPQQTMHSLATGVFVNFREQRKEQPVENNEAKRAVDIHYVTQVMMTIAKGAKPCNEKMVVFNQLINDWFAALYKLNQPLPNYENSHTHNPNKE